MYVYINGAEPLCIAVENGSRTRGRTAAEQMESVWREIRKMGLVFLVGVMLVGAVCGQDASRVVQPSSDDSVNDSLVNTKLLAVFVMFRHGDRTPDQEELTLYPSDQRLNDRIFFPYGMKALTNKGKQRSFIVGKYLRQTYDGFISRLYLPDEITVRTTDFARTKMTALTALAAMFPPPPAQQWNPELNWQPVPYDTLPYAEDDLLYWYNCPRYLWLRNKMYEAPEIKKWLEPYQYLYKYLSQKTGTNITTPEDVFFLDNLFQTLKNVGIDPPKWAQEVMPKIQDVTKLEYAIELYDSELIRLASGVLMKFILNTTSAAIHNTSYPIEPKMYLFSAHENNVAAMMAAVKVFEPHQPNYGATFSLELRQNWLTGEYGMTAVYAREAGGPAKMLTIDGCGGRLFCNYEKFVGLVQDVAWSQEKMRQQCNILS